MPTDQAIERAYIFSERLGISCGAGEPTADELRRATAETDAFLADLERVALTERIATMAAINRRDYHLKKRFGK